VPTDIYKAVYVPGRRQAGAYLVANAVGGQWRAVSVAQLREITGLDVFPDLAPETRDRAMDLPDPGPRRRQRQGAAGDAGSHADGFAVVGGRTD
jgi:endonuclease G